ncbi:MAG: PIN domain-containing protein [Desulfovermiculus sp.]
MSDDHELSFLDTNILVYAYDQHVPQKMQIARQILKQGLLEKNVFLSAQVLGEFFVVVTKKIKEPLAPAAALEIIEALSILPFIETDYPLIVKAITHHLQFKISYWDSLIVAAAERSGCNTLLTEDLKDREMYNGVKVLNPFK